MTLPTSRTPRMRPSISFLQVPEPQVVKNGVHLDLQVGGD